MHRRVSPGGFLFFAFIHFFLIITFSLTFSVCLSFCAFPCLLLSLSRVSPLLSLSLSLSPSPSFLVFVTSSLFCVCYRLSLSLSAFLPGLSLYLSEAECHWVPGVCGGCNSQQLRVKFWFKIACLWCHSELSSYLKRMFPGWMSGSRERGYSPLIMSWSEIAARLCDRFVLYVRSMLA